MAIDPLTLDQPWQMPFLPVPDRTNYQGAQGTTWTARSGAALTEGSAWVEVAVAADTLVEVADSAPTDTSGAELVRAGDKWQRQIGAGVQVWVRSRTGTAHVSTSVWILEAP